MTKNCSAYEKMLQDNASFDVTLAKVKGRLQVRHYSQVHWLFYPWRGTGTTEIEPVIDMAVDDLKRKLRKLKTYLVDKKRKGGMDQIASMLEPIEEVTMDDFESYDSSAADIQRKKNIQLQMMTDDEAVVQMEMLGHSFFVYLAPNGQTCVIYKRGKGYGQLICS